MISQKLIAIAVAVAVAVAAAVAVANSNIIAIAIAIYKIERRCSRCAFPKSTKIYRTH